MRSKTDTVGLTEVQQSSSRSPYKRALIAKAKWDVNGSHLKLASRTADMEFKVDAVASLELHGPQTALLSHKALPALIHCDTIAHI
jgi:hypothetical protein